MFPCTKTLYRGGSRFPDHKLCTISLQLNSSSGILGVATRTNVSTSKLQQHNLCWLKALVSIILAVSWTQTHPPLVFARDWQAAWQVRPLGIKARPLLLAIPLWRTLDQHQCCSFISSLWQVLCYPAVCISPNLWTLPPYISSPRRDWSVSHCTSLPLPTHCYLAVDFVSPLALLHLWRHFALHKMTKTDHFVST